MPQEAVPVLFFHASNDNLHQLQVWLHPAHIYFFLYFSSYSDQIVLHLQKWLYFIIHCVSTHYYLFIFWFVNRVSLVPGQSRHAAGGGERPQSANPPPAHVYLSLSLSSPSIKRLYSASAALYLGEPPLVTPQISRMIFALP